MPSIDQQLAEMAATPPAQPETGEPADNVMDYETISPDDVTEVNQQVMEAEQKLSELGYDVGEVDGMFDTATQESLKAFKSEHGMDDADDPTLTGQTMEALVAAAPEGLSTEGQQGQPAGEGEMNLALGG